MATSTLKSNASTNVSVSYTAGEHVTVNSVAHRYSKSGVAHLFAQFHITTETVNGETLITLNNVKSPKSVVITPIVSSANKAYGTVELTSGGLLRSAGTLSAGDWYAVTITYLYL